MGMVLRRRADHRRAADVDVLDRLREIGAPGDRRLERVEVHHQDIDRLDAVRLHRRYMRGFVAHREQAAVHPWMQRLDAAVHDLGKPGHFGNLGDRNARLRQHRPGAAGGEDHDAALGERAREVRKAGLVGNGEERPTGYDAGRFGGHSASPDQQTCAGR
jgi:hypothetical protein